MNTKSYYQRIKRTWLRLFLYCTEGVWNDTRSNFIIDTIKTINLSVYSFLDKNLQQKASALTYSTLLAIVPALAMLFAIGRGFGFQNILQSELFKYLPAQQEALKAAFKFVDSYLAQSSEGIFVGIGIIFLLWTLISLIMNVEDSFNQIWGIRKSRNLYRKITDYTAIFLILPILMICESGISIFVSTITDETLLSPIVKVVFDIAPFILTWFFFAGAFALIPNTKVQFKYALLFGILCGSAFQILQWLFVTGQLYVSKYNAIYGSFAFLPLLLIWLQLTWLITLAGVVLTYSSQNIFSFNYRTRIQDISIKYLNNITIIVLALIIKRFEKNENPFSIQELSQKYEIPIKLITQIIEKLIDIKLIVCIDSESTDVKTYQPAMDINQIKLSTVISKLSKSGNSNFLKDFDKIFKNPITYINDLTDETAIKNSDILIKDITMHLNNKKI